MATIQVRVDDELKAQADALFNVIGLDTPTAIRAFLKQSVLHRGLPFALRADPRLQWIEAALDEADAEEAAGARTVGHEEFMREMRSLLHELSN